MPRGFFVAKLHRVQTFAGPGKSGPGVCVFESRLLGPPGGQPGDRVRHRRLCSGTWVCAAVLGWQVRSAGGGGKAGAG